MVHTHNTPPLSPSLPPPNPPSYTLVSFSVVALNVDGVGQVCVLGASRSPIRSPIRSRIPSRAEPAACEPSPLPIATGSARCCYLHHPCSAHGVLCGGSSIEFASVHKVSTECGSIIHSIHRPFLHGQSYLESAGLSIEFASVQKVSTECGSIIYSIHRPFLHGAVVLHGAVL